MPSNTTSSVFFYVYVLEGLSFSTKFRLPFKLIYFEGCINQEDAKRRENYLKTTQGRRFLGLRLQEYKRCQSAFGSGS